MPKVVQDFKAEIPYELLSDSCKALFYRIKATFTNVYDIKNIVFREIDNKIYIILHISVFDGFEPASLFLFDWSHVRSLSVHNHKHFDRIQSRIQIFGPSIDYFYLSDALIYFSADSFLQKDLKQCIEIYNSVKERLALSDSFVGIGDDIGNIGEFLGLRYYNLFHCKSSIFEKSVGTFDVDEWLMKISNPNPGSDILIITPGRNGLRELKKYTSNFRVIIYFSCGYFVDDFSDDGYILKEKIFFPEVNETIYFWCKPEIISIGNDCSIAYNFGTERYPFDWCKVKKIGYVTECIKNNFSGYDDLELVKVKDNLNFFFDVEKQHRNTAESDESDGNFYNMIQCRNKYNIEFFHDIRLGHEIDDSIVFKEKMKRRIKRFQQYGYKRFIRYENNKLLKEELIPILSECDELIIITPFSEKINFSDKRLKVLSDSFIHTGWQKEKIKSLIN